ncbi:MAG: hypothetical protein K1X36_01675, partial [Pyrinomonadaceae bacterium]|nr:hypothetical protein [Pyrinomonadaceae bacterium]
MRFNDESEILDVVRRFEDRTIRRDEWKHAEHLTVALYFLTLDDLEAATDRMRTGIFNLLGTFGVDLSQEMPYHETLTVFWMNTVDNFNRNNQ